MELLHALEGIRSPILDTIFGLITMLGEETVVIVLLGLIYWCINKRTAYVIGIAYFFSGLVIQGAKIGFQIDRPWIVDPTLKPVASAIPGATGYSFPSGHTQSVTALFGTLALKLRQMPVKVVCVLIILLVAFSRMYLGVHTPLDVGVSLMVTALIVLIVARMLSDDTAGNKREIVLTVILGLCAIAVIVVASVMYTQGTIEQNYLTDCLKAAGAGIGFTVGMCIESACIDFSVRTKNILWQIIKFVLGIAGVLLIKEGLKLVLGTGFVVDTARYFLIGTWVTVFFPLIIKRFFTPRNTDAS